ncbi:hypothetical protein [Deinococcus sp.]|uniref:hypothetical protein n=1 Tax=Deinococcus sp. TaxID=47478 RepID=UPI0025E519B0|nr:hypothetical protein [Deinococcus sp.]
MTKVWLSLLLSGAMLLSGCSNCADSGLYCRLPTEGGPVPVGDPVDAEVARGQSLEVSIRLSLGEVPASATLEFVPGPRGEVLQNDPTLLASLDGGRVTVKRLTSSFTGTLSRVVVSAAPNATPTTDLRLNASFAVRVQGSSGTPGGVPLLVKVR